MTQSTGAQAKIIDGQIVISIDIDALPTIVSGSIAAGDGPMADYLYKVTDPAAFAEEVKTALNDESEIGTTLVHQMFDQAFANAIDQGAEGVEEIDEDEFEEEALLLQDEDHA